MSADRPVSGREGTVERFSLVQLCQRCLAGEGGECHTPGCGLWANRAPDIPVTALEPSDALAALEGEGAVVLDRAEAETVREWGCRAMEADEFDGWNELDDALLTKLRAVLLPVDGEG